MGSPPPPPPAATATTTAAAALLIFLSQDWNVVVGAVDSIRSRNTYTFDAHKHANTLYAHIHTLAHPPCARVHTPLPVYPPYEYYTRTQTHTHTYIVVDGGGRSWQL